MYEKKAEIARVQATLKTSTRIVNLIIETDPLLPYQEQPAFPEIGNSPIGNTGDESFNVLSDEVLTKIVEDKTTVDSTERPVDSTERPVGSTETTVDSTETRYAVLHDLQKGKSFEEA